MTKAETLADQLVTLNVTELMDVKRILEEKYGLKMEVPVTTVAVKEEEPVVEKKTEFSVRLKKDKLEVTTVKMNAIRLVKDVTGLVLHEAKAIVDKVLDVNNTEPVFIKENLSEAEAQSIGERFTTIGAVVELV